MPSKPWLERVCRCGQEFRTKRENCMHCSHRCARVTTAEKKWKRFPADPVKRRELLERLYIQEEMTTPEIGAVIGTDHKVVLSALRGLGIPRRRAGQIRLTTCCEPDCGLPVFNVKHRTNGYTYGRRCRLHWIIFRMEVNQRYNDKTLKLGKDESWLRRVRQLLARVRRLNREVSRSLKPESTPATTSPDACPR